MPDVRGGFASVSGRKPVTDGHALVEGAEVGRAQAVGQAQLPDEDNLQRRFVGQPRQPLDLFEHMDGQLLRLVDDEERPGAERRQRPEELFERAQQVAGADASQQAAADLLTGDHAEVLQDQPQQVFFRDIRD